MARIKNVEAFCTVCGGIRKMELAGEANGTDQENKRWAKTAKSTRRRSQITAATAIIIW